MTTSPGLVVLAHVFDGAIYKLFQDLFIYIGQPLDIETGLARLELAELIHQGLEMWEARNDVHAQCLLAWRKSRHQEVAFATACVFVVVGTVAHNTRAPHFRALTGGFAHHCSNFSRIRALLPVIYRVDEIRNARTCCLCFVFSHAVMP